MVVKLGKVYDAKCGTAHGCGYAITTVGDGGAVFLCCHVVAFWGGEGDVGAVREGDEAGAS